LNLDGLSPFFGLSFNFGFNFLKHLGGTGDADSGGSNGGLGLPEIRDALQGVLVEHLLLGITEACLGGVLILWSWVNTSEGVWGTCKTLGTVFDFSNCELAFFEMSLEVKCLLGFAELKTIGNVTCADAIFTIVGTEIWSIYWFVLAEAGLWSSWMWILSTERCDITGGPA